MKFYADTHIHSRFSRATSTKLTLEHLSLWAQLKGIQVIGTGDCIHPGWLSELKEKLEPAEQGFFKLRDCHDTLSHRELPAACKGTVRFILSVEISNIYKRYGGVRRVHNIVFMPSFEAADRLQKKLERIGNIYADGRPILGLDSRDLLEIVIETDPLGYLVPAHIWTPWFSVLGSKGGFNSLQDCFGDLTGYIFALETGLSSDPAMNWRLSQLDSCALVSNSDAHSPDRLGREATVYDTDFTYAGIYGALKDAASTGLAGTVEFFPEEGKYHYDGHRECAVRLSPQETARHNGICLVCGRPVTVGVMSRVEELADHPQGRKSPRAKPYQSLIPFAEIIAEAKGKGVASQAVQKPLHDAFARIGNEMFILTEAPIDEIKKVTGPVAAEGVQRMRDGKVTIAAGYDGEYGKISIFSQDERDSSAGRQLNFFD